MSDLEIYRNKKVFITGHTGFKGSWLTLILNRLDAEVCGYALGADSSDLYSIINGDQFCKSIVSDIRDYEKLKAAILDFEPDLILHLAAQPLVLESYEDPIGTLTTNVNGTINILQIAHESSMKTPILVVTTDKVYSNSGDGNAFVEEDKLGGNDIYSASKSATEIIAHAYNKSFFQGRQVYTARAGNVIGGGDFSDNRIIPDLIKAYKSNQTLKLRNPGHVRPWQHVLESLAGYLILGECILQGDAVKHSYNFGPSSESFFTVQELIEEAKKHLAGGIDLHLGNESGKESTVLKLDSKNAIQDLLWSPKWGFQETVKNTIDWYMETEKPLHKTMSQIDSYFEL